MLGRLLEACESHAQELGCAGELECVRELSERPGARRQLDLADGDDRLPGLVETLADAFTA
jgi:hypothetical protein